MGLLDMTPEQSNMLLNLGQGLLSASGPSRTPVNFGQALAGGIGQMQQGQRDFTQSQLQNQHLKMQQMQMEQAVAAQALAKQRQAAVQELLPTLSPDLQRAYQMGVPPDKIFDAMQMEKNSTELGQFLGGSAPAAAPRPYQSEVEAAQANPAAGRIVADTPEQRAGVERNLALMDAKYPQEAARLREQLIQQGLITPAAPQRQQPTAEQIGDFGARWAAQGRKGGDELMKLAALRQPNVKVLDNGSGNLMYDANSGAFIGAPMAKGMSPKELSDTNRANSEFTWRTGQGIGGQPASIGGATRPGLTPEASAQVAAKEAESVAGKTGEILDASAAAAKGAVSSIQQAHQLRDALADNKALLGPFASQRMSMAQVSSLLGVGGADDAEKIANTRAVINGLANMSLDAASKLKGQGQVTEGERKLLERSASADINELTIPELRQLSDIVEKQSTRVYANHKQMIEKAKGQGINTWAFEAPDIPEYVYKLPANPKASELKQGALYKTSKGDLRWRGVQFEDK